MSILLDIADAVSDELAAGVAADVFSTSFTPVSAAIVRYELKDLKVVRVTCIPAALELTGASRGASHFEAHVDVGVQKRVGVGAAMTADMTELTDLVQEIAVYLRGRRLSGMPAVRWVRTAIDPVYVRAHLDEQRTFTSVVSAWYKGILA